MRVQFNLADVTIHEIPIFRPWGKEGLYYTESEIEKMKNDALAEGDEFIDRDSLTRSGKNLFHIKFEFNEDTMTSSSIPKDIVKTNKNSDTTRVREHRSSVGRRAIVSPRRTNRRPQRTSPKGMMQHVSSELHHATQ